MMRYLKINHADIHLLIDILDELEEKKGEEIQLQAKLEEIYRRMKDAKAKKREHFEYNVNIQTAT